MAISKLHATLLSSCVLLSLHAYAGDWQHMTDACKIAKEKPNRQNIEDCAIKFYGLTPVGPQIGSIAPQGSVALGLRATHTIIHPPSASAPPDTKSKESHFTARGLYSITNFYLMEGRYDFLMPALGQGGLVTNPGAAFSDRIDLSVFASRVNLNTQRFYGPGENSTTTGLAEYRQLQDKVGASADWPITSWFSAGGTVQWIAPRILGVSGTSVPSVASVYNNAAAPGILSQPNFLNPKGYLDVHTGSNTTQTWQRTKLRATFEHFADLDSSAYSFHRISGIATTSFDLRRPLSTLTLPWWKSMFCEPLQGGQCSVGQLVFTGLATASYTGTGSSVPFYFQPTLGGTDINGVDTLRGLSDFRLRDANRVLLQAQFDHHLWSLFGISGFYDVGKVAANPGDLSLSHLRHDIGIGAFIKIQNKVVLRAYLGFGAGEGIHPGFKLPTASWGNWESVPMATFP
jgi:hypothetical protein